MIEALYDLLGNQVQIWTLDPTNGWQLRATFSGVGFAPVMSLARGTVGSDCHSL